MKILIFLIWMCYHLPVQPQDMNRHAYCETCLTTAREIEEAMTKAPVESRQTIVDQLISEGVCEKLLSFKREDVSKGKTTSTCKHLLDSFYDQLHVTLADKEPKHLDLVLCYEQSMACVGVKRESFESSKTTFTDSHIEALLQDNKEHVRIAQPIHPGSPVHSKEEL